MGIFDDVIKGALKGAKLITERERILKPVEDIKEVDDPLDVDIPSKPTMGTAGPVDDTTLVNELPSCIKCGSTMMLQGKGVQLSKLGTPVECVLTFCPKCKQTAFMMARAKFNRDKPSEKPTLAFEVFWSRPVSRKEDIKRLHELETRMKKYDSSKAKAKEERGVDSPN